MHYYKRNLGDYAKKAGRLSMLQHGSYTLLIDACYDREQFPTRDEAIDWTWASSTAEIEAVDFVLAKFFVLEDGFYIQTRIREELAEYQAKATKNQRIAIDRETKRKENSTERARNVNEAPPNHKPLTINHKPIGRERATRIPPGFEPEPEDEAEAGIDRPLELANFRDYWMAKSGVNATKLDWQATWRQWARKADRPGVSRFSKPAPNLTVAVNPDVDRTRQMLDADSAIKRTGPSLLVLAQMAKLRGVAA